MATVETYQLRGRNYDEVVRQLISTYNVANGWSLVRVVNRLTSLDVILERNSEQGKETSKDTFKGSSKATSNTVLLPTEKVVDADATASDEQLSPSTGTTQPLETKEVVKDVSKDTTTDKPVAVKTTRKSKLGE
mgnify:CR=1 FL=1